MRMVLQCVTVTRHFKSRGVLLNGFECKVREKPLGTKKCNRPFAVHSTRAALGYEEHCARVLTMLQRDYDAVVLAVG
jgi:hypothetical protein